MSRGIGALQRRLLAIIEKQDPPMASARQLVGMILAEDHGTDLEALMRRLRPLDRSVRRGLRLLERRGLVVEIKQRPVCYAMSGLIAELSEGLEKFAAWKARGRPVG